jgi:putative inorganic carbon (HCO3(-)) transporter
MVGVNAFSIPLSASRLIWADRFDRVSAVVLFVAAVAIPVLLVPNVDDVFVGPKTILLRLLTFVAVITAAASVILGRRALLIRVPDVAVGVFIVVTSVATVVSVDPLTSLHGEPLQRAGFISFAAIAAGYLVARTTISSVGRLRMLMTATAIGASLVALYGLVQWWGMDPIWDVLPNDRVVASLGQPNWLGAYLVITIPVTVAVAYATPSRIARVGLAGSGVAQTAVLVTTLSRSSWLGLLTATLITLAIVVALIWSRGTIGGSTVRLAAAAVGVATVLVVLVMATPLATTSPVRRALSAFELGAFDIRQHLALWEVGAAITVDHPLIGTGPDTYAIVFPSYRDEVVQPYYADYLSRFRPESPHNVYLALAAGAGFIALGAQLAALIGGLVIIVRAALRTRSGRVLLIGVSAATAGHLVTDAFMTMDVATTWLMWVLLGGGIAVAHGLGAPRQPTELSTDTL